MIKKVKIFQEKTHELLEEKINNWLSETPCQIEGAIQTESKYITISIFYYPESLDKLEEKLDGFILSTND